MTDEFDPIPVRRAPDDSTPWGRIEGRDKHKYARLWRIDLTGKDGPELFDLTFKMCFVAHVEAEGAIGEPGYRRLDEEEFARAYQPMTEADYIEEIIADVRRAADLEPGSDPDPDPEARH